MKKIIFSLLLLTFSNVILAQQPATDSTGQDTTINNNMPDTNNQMTGDSAAVNSNMPENNMASDTTGPDGSNNNMNNSSNQTGNDSNMVNNNLSDNNMAADTSGNNSTNSDMNNSNMNNSTNTMNSDSNMATDTSMSNSNMNNTTDTQGNNMSNNNNQANNSMNSMNTGMTGLSSAGYVAAPQMQTFVSPDMVSKITSKFGSSIYDITSVKGASGSAEYVVRMLENGQLRTQHIGEDANPIVK